MLTREIMGGLALAILWVNTLLVAAAALKDLGAILARIRALGPIVRGRVLCGDGRTGAIAGHRIEQIGRAGPETRGGETIVFHDRSYGGEIYGGRVAIEGDRPREVTIAPAVEAEVWVAGDAVAAAGACPSAARFDEAYTHARKARGYSRTVEAMVREGAEVWLAGGDEAIAPALLSTVDPRSWARSRVALIAAFAAGEIAVAAGCTALALVPPVFGTVSTIGAALCLLFFLLVQPAGTAVRGAVRPPSRAIARGRWERRGLAGSAPVAAG